MEMMKKFLCTLLILGLICSIVPPSVFSADTQQVYISISEEGQFIKGKDGTPMAYRAVALDALKNISLEAYGLRPYHYDTQGDGIPEITALHLFIYVHQELLGMDFSQVDTSMGSPGSLYFSENLFGFSDENLRYDYNGSYPADKNGRGITADRIVLNPGDYLDVAHYEDWNFYRDSAYGFHYFGENEDQITHNFTVEAGKPMSANILLVTGGMGTASKIQSEENYRVFYGKTMGTAEGCVTTSTKGSFSLTFPAAGTWYLWCEGDKGVDLCPNSIVSSPGCAIVHVTAPQTSLSPPSSEKGQDVSTVLYNTMAHLGATVTEPTFGTSGGEWTVLALARGAYYPTDSAYFRDYYNRITDIVNSKAEKIKESKPELAGALHKSKSTDNSRLIVALSSIGKEATSVGNWDLTAPYSNFQWIKNQGINGAIWALIALDSRGYPTTDPTIRQQCIDYILNAELAEGGWALSGTNLDVDITAMALQSLYPYRGQTAVGTAVEKAFSRLSQVQLANGGFLYGTAETSESTSQVIVACTTWGINPDTDPRFVKNGHSVVDNLLSYYIEEEAMFAHQGTLPNDMATDQACYALVAYGRLQKGKTALYDFSDMNPDHNDQSKELTASLGLPVEINNGEPFHGVITMNHWDTDAEYKLIDLVALIPSGVTVTNVTPGRNLSGGSLNWNLENATGKLRLVYFDANKNQSLSLSGEETPAELFTISFRGDQLRPNHQLHFSLSGMSLKRNSDSSQDASMVVVNTDSAKGVVTVVEGISFSAVCLYKGDDVDLIPSSKKAVAVAVTGIAKGAKLTYHHDHYTIPFYYSHEIQEKTGVSTYVALVDEGIPMENFVTESYFTIEQGNTPSLTFGDINGDDVINAQDALAVVDTWLRKGDAPTDSQILAMNINGDSRINTFDALGIVEAFVTKADYGIVTKAATITTKDGT